MEIMKTVHLDVHGNKVLSSLVMVKFSNQFLEFSGYVCSITVTMTLKSGLYCETWLRKKVKNEF